MKNNRKALIVAGGVLAAAAASGGAFTAGLTQTADPTDVVAAGTVAVDGATVLDVQYAHDGTDITTVAVVFDDLYTGGTTFQLWVGGVEFTAEPKSQLEFDGGLDEEETRVVFNGSAPISSSTETRIAVNGDSA